MLFERLLNTIEHLDAKQIPPARKTVLNELAHFVNSSIKNKADINLNFICTHNSRRSQFAQIWMQTLANFYGHNEITCYSGGTEVTAIYPMVLNTLTNQGFQINLIVEQQNAVFAIKSGKNNLPLIAFSKKYNDAFNPQSDYCAILTCDSADESCPVVHGAASRFAMTYKDPKYADNTDTESEAYWTTSLTIANEMHYVLSLINLH